MAAISEEFLSEGLDHAPVWLILSNRKSGLVHYANEAVRTALGMENVVPLTFSELDLWVDSADRRQLIDQIRHQKKADASKRSQAQVKMAGFAHLVTKPLDVAGLIDVIAQFEELTMPSKPKRKCTALTDD